MSVCGQSSESGGNESGGNSNNNASSGGATESVNGETSGHSSRVSTPSQNMMSSQVLNSLHFDLRKELFFSVAQVPFDFNR